MNWGKCNFSGLEEFQKKIDMLNKSGIDDICVDCSKALAARLLALVIPRTPVGIYPAGSGKQGGTLRRGWGGRTQNFDVRKEGHNYIVEVINPTEYASYVEFGHRTRNGGWVPGQYFLTISEERLKNIAPGVLEKIIEERMRRYLNG